MINNLVKNKEALSVKCRETTIGEAESTVRSLIDAAKFHSINNAIGCAGLAANQIGSNLRVFVMWIDNENTFQPMINPEIVKVHKRSGKKTMVEGCLSRPGVRAKKTRFKKIRARYMNEKGVYIERNFSNFNARVFQHELNHLDGITI